MSLSPLRAQSPAFSTLYFFAGGSDGATPQAGLVEDRKNPGTFYGITLNTPTFFRVSSGGTFTVLYTFNGENDGNYAYGGLIQGKDGNFYGTTVEGGINNNGTVFKITPDGTLTTLYSFSPLSQSFTNTDGASPYGGLVEDRN